MYEAHGWFGLAETPTEADDGMLLSKISQLQEVIQQASWPNIQIEIVPLNGQYWLIFNAFLNRGKGRAEVTFIDDLLVQLVSLLPGSWGLMYESDDEIIIPPGPGSYRVTVLARGKLEHRLDPFMSPRNPIIEN